MAQWKETLEPYVKVYETVRNSVLNPSAGGELIIGCAFISDAGPPVRRNIYITGYDHQSGLFRGSGGKNIYLWDRCRTGPVYIFAAVTVC